MKNWIAFWLLKLIITEFVLKKHLHQSIFTAKFISEKYEINLFSIWKLARHHIQFNFFLCFEKQWIKKFGHAIPISVYFRSRLNHFGAITYFHFDTKYDDFIDREKYNIDALSERNFMSNLHNNTRRNLSYYPMSCFVVKTYRNLPTILGLQRNYKRRDWLFSENFFRNIYMESAMVHTRVLNIESSGILWLFLHKQSGFKR